MEQATSPAHNHRIWRRALPLLPLVLLLAGWLLSSTGSELLHWSVAGFNQAGLVLLLAALYTMPGWALLRLLWPRDQRPELLVAWGLACGLSVALPPLLLLLMALVNLPWNAATTWAYLLVSTALVLWPASADGRGFALRGGRWPWRAPAINSYGLLLVGVLLLILLVRLFAIRGLPTGMLGDSYHHTLIAQLMVDQQGLFESWQPYAPLATMTYHFGFHANAAFIHWVSGAPLPESVLWAGQILNTLAVLLVAALTMAFGGGLTGGLWAAVLTGFVLLLPGYFVNWGRYTQLTGQVVLLATLLCWHALAARTAQRAATAAPHTAHDWWQAALQTSRSNGGLLLLTGGISAAMMLTHYRVVMFAALFVAVLLAAWIVVQRSRVLLVLLLVQAALAAMLALLITLPWLANVLEGHLMRNTVAMVQGTTINSQQAQVANIPNIHPLYVRNYLIAPMIGGLLLAVWQRVWPLLLCAPWAVLLVLCLEPGLIGLPGDGVIDSLTALGSLYLVVVPPAAYLLATLLYSLTRLMRLPALAGCFITAVLLAVVIGGTVPEHAAIVHGDTQLVTEADMAAMAWIRAETPQDARFLVNSFPAYGGTLVAGTDAGWWLPLFTGRTSTLPPITYGSERSNDPDYARQVNELAAFLRGRPLTDSTAVAIDVTTPEALARLRAEEIDYVYSGTHASPPATHADRIDTDQLRDSTAFELVYDHAGVTIFRLDARN